MTALPLAGVKVVEIAQNLGRAPTLGEHNDEIIGNGGVPA